jgi:hypothetical protein
MERIVQKVSALTLATMTLLLMPGTAQARGRHHGFGGGFGHDGHGMHANGAEAFAGNRGHAEDPHVKAALQEEERGLKKLSSICRGC